MDANILFAAAIKEGTTAELLFSDRLELISPEYVLTELANHKAELLEKTGRSDEEFDKFFAIVWSRVKVIPSEELKSFLNKAEEISPDPDDVQYFALALRYDCPVWSNDSGLRGQSEVKVLPTKELLELIK